MEQMDTIVLGIPDDECQFDAYVMESDEEWLDFRKAGIGGSDASTVLGINKYRTPLTMWLEKTGRMNPPDLSGRESVEWGNRLEASIRSKFAEMHPEFEVSEFNASLVNKDRPWAHANLDGKIRDKDGNYGILEIKTVGKRRESDWADGVPDYYLAQVTHYMSVTGWRFTYVAALIGGQHYVEYRVDWDDDDVAFVSERVDEFWNDYVMAGVMPEAMGTSDESEAAFEMNKSGEGNARVTETAAMALFDDLVDEFVSARDAEKEAKKKKDEAASKLRMIIGENKSVSSDVYKVIWVRSNKLRFDYRQLEKEHPEIYERYAKRVPSDMGMRVYDIAK